MPPHTAPAALAVTLLWLAGAAGAQAPAVPVAELAGTSWQLVRFQGGDGTLLVPAVPAHYTPSFAADGTLSARIDCNRGRGTWQSPRRRAS